MNPCTLTTSLFAGLLLSGTAQAQTEYTICLYDSARARPVPVAIYEPAKINQHTPVIIFNHGYDANKGNSYLAYSWLTRALSKEGYYVISIQHELPGDPLLSMQGDFMQTRKPNWEQGVRNILFTLRTFKKLKPGLDWNRLTLMGHSNGADMTMLFATEHPDKTNKAISLDHRRMIMPRTTQPRIYSLRGCDYEADKNVIPTPQEQAKYQVTIIKLDGVAHSDMDNKGSREKHRLMLKHIFECLKQR